MEIDRMDTLYSDPTSRPPLCDLLLGRTDLKWFTFAFRKLASCQKLRKIIFKGNEACY
jgi:hypothetical protein